MSDLLPFPAGAVALGLRATVLLALALAVSWAVGHCRVRLASAICHAGLAALLLLPLSLLLPVRCRLACLPDTAAVPAEATDERSPGIPTLMPADPVPTPDTAALPAEVPERGVALAAEAPFGDPDRAIATETVSDRPAAVSWAWAVPAYLGGVGLCLVRLAAGLRAVSRLKASGDDIRDPFWLDTLKRWRWQVGLRRQVALRGSSLIRVPMTVGWRRPVILLPQPWAGAEDARQRDAVVLHELAHVQRADYLWLLVLRLVQAVYWIHPLTWLLEPLARSLRERACDELCVYWMAGPAEYRRALLEIALALKQRRECQPGLAMVRSSRLGRRLRHIDGSAGTASALARRPVRLMLLAAGLITAVLLGAVELAPRAPAAPVAEGTGQDTAPAAAGLAGLRHEQIPAYELKVAGGGDPAKAPAALVGVLGDSRLHQGFVHDVAFSPDGRLLAATDSETLVLWDPDTGEEQQRLVGRTPDGRRLAYLAGVAFSPDGRTVASGSVDGAIYFWDVASGRQLRLLRIDSWVTRLAFSPDGRLLAVGHTEDAAVWDLTADKLLHRLTHAPGFRRQYSTDPVTVVFARDGRTLFVGHPDGTLCSWEVSTGKLLRKLQAHDVAVQSLALSKDSKYLATGSRDKAVRLWEAETGRLRHTIQAHEHYVQAVAFHPDGKTLASGGLDGKVKYWDVATGQPGLNFPASRSIGVSALTFRPDGKALASGGLSVRLWDAVTGKPRFDFPGHVGSVQAVAFRLDGKLLASCGYDGTVKVWEPGARAPRQSLDLGGSGVAAVAFSPQGTTVAALESRERSVYLWDLTTGESQKAFQAAGEYSRWSLTFSPDGRWVAAMILDRRRGAAVTLWDAVNRKLHAELATGAGWLFFSPDSRKLIVAGPDHGPGQQYKSSVKTWDVATLRLETHVEDPAQFSYLRGAALSPDGRTLALSGYVYGADEQSTEVLIFWDVTKQRPRLTIDLGRFGTDTLTFAPDGRSLLGGAWRNAIVRVWDPRDGKLRETHQFPTPPPGSITDLRFAPDSRHYAAAMSNGTIDVFRIEPPPENVPERTTAAAPPVRPSDPTVLWKALAGKPAPEFQQLKGWVSGKPVRLADLRGRHVLLHFWNLNSERTVAELIRAHEWFGGQGVSILLVFPDYDSSLEIRRRQLAVEGQQWWGGRDLPFPVALDGGGDTAIPGTPFKASGATHAAFRIPDSQRGRRLDGTTLLINPDGTVAQRIDEPLTRNTVELALGKRAKQPAWVEDVERRYALRPGQVLRRVAPPFPPEWTNYLLLQELPFIRGTHVFQFEQTLALERSSSADGLRLSHLLPLLTRLKSRDIAGPDEVLRLEVPGCWIYRKGATQAELLAALEAIVRDELKQPVRIRHREVEREAVVVRGRFELKPLTGDPNMVHFFAGEVPPPDGAAGTARSLQELLDDFQNIVQCYVVNEAADPGRLNLRWRNNLAGYGEGIRADTPAGAAKLRAALDNLAKQTGLQFSNERRPARAWEVTKEP
jgi:WD40 repeat protein/beta-lactamase regulating signal transducer with metallopeptidase domain